MKPADKISKVPRVGKKTQKPRILVVDDDPDMRMYYSALLRTGGYHPIVASDPGEGLEKVKKEKPVFIIINVPMPENGGMQMYRCLKQDVRLCCIPVIMVSTIDRQTFTLYQKTKGIRLGSDIKDPEAFLEKPPEASELLGLIHETLTRSVESHE